jgi:hypothetical protein
MAELETVTNMDMVRVHLNISESDSPGLVLKVLAAEDFIGKFIGKELSAFDPISENRPIPDAITMAVFMLAGHLWENREATLVGISAEQVPFGVLDLIAPYREYVF